MDQATHLRNIIKKHEQKYASRVITVTSGKGGVGKSNVCVNLAIQFKKLGKRVIIFDADFGLANIEVIFGIVPKYNLFDMIYNNKEITDIITEGPLGIEFISGGSGVMELLKLDRYQINYMLDKLHDLDRIADIIIIDTGAGISDSVLNFVMSSSELLLITTPEPTAITDAYAVLKAVKNRDLEVSKINVLVNQVEYTGEGDDIFEKLQKVTDKYLSMELNHIGSLPADKHLVKAVVEQKPVGLLYPSCKITKAFERLGADLLETKVEKRGIVDIFSGIFKFRKI